MLMKQNVNNNVRKDLPILYYIRRPRVGCLTRIFSPGCHLGQLSFLLCVVIGDPRLWSQGLSRL